MRGATYEQAGVSLGTADAVVERLLSAVDSTGASGFGTFAGLHPLDDRRLLAASDYDGSDLLAPTRLYPDDVRRLRGRAHAFAHVTGGGIAGNVARVVPAGLRARIDWEAWERPPVFAWLARHADEEELRRVFNLGIGYCAVVSDPGNDLVVGRIERA